MLHRFESFQSLNESNYKLYPKTWNAKMEDQLIAMLTDAGVPEDMVTWGGPDANTRQLMNKPPIIQVYNKEMYDLLHQKFKEAHWI